MLLNLLKKSTTYKNFTWARAQVCHVHPTPMIKSTRLCNFSVPKQLNLYVNIKNTDLLYLFVSVIFL